MFGSIPASASKKQVGIFAYIDWPLFIAALILSVLGLVTMYSFGGENAYFEHQVVWIALGIIIFFGASFIDYRFLRKTLPVAGLYAIAVSLLTLVFVFGVVVKGAQSRFDLGFFAVQPSDFAMLAVIILLAKYFARRHIEIAQFRHIIVSGLYAAVPFLLILLQPDLGSAIILASIWLGMVLVSGINKKHLLAVALLALIAAGGLWTFGLHDYQKQRVMTFLNPLEDRQGAGYNAYQSVIAVGSGELTGRGIGYGTQSKLRFLPEYQTDFIFAAYAEEWGLIGVLFLFGLYGIVLWRILALAGEGGSNFETLFAVGVGCLFASHFAIHVGINLGLLPVTGTTTPFMSYGGSHLLTEYLSLGMLMGMRRYARLTRPGQERADFEPVLAKG